MNQSEIKILRFDAEHPFTADHSKSLKQIAAEWEASQEFWTADSCLRTMRNHPRIISAAAINTSNNAWEGWYLATVQEDQAELLFIFTRKGMRRSGVGRKMLVDLIDQVKSTGEVKSLFLEVRPSNISAITLYKGLGFKEVSRRVRYYSDGEDAIVYEYSFNR